MKLRIRELRKSRGLTQKEVAMALLCDPSLYSRYENGRRALPLEAALRLAEYYGVSLDYLTGRSGVTRRSASVTGNHSGSQS